MAAESILISLSSKILTSIASPVIEKAYEEGVSIWEARDDLVKLQETIGTLQTVMIDAEKKQEESDSVKNWIKRVKGVLYDAQDLFDEVAADDLLEEFMMEGSLEKQVFSKLNPIAKRVKAIRERLDDIYTSKSCLGFAQNQPIVTNTKGENHVAMGSIYERASTNGKFVIGRDEDKKVILEMLSNESSDTLVVISIEGIGGMGKTTLARMIYNTDEVENIFEYNRWYARISDTTDEKEVLGKIYQSISGLGYSDLNVLQLEKEIKKSITGKKYLLVLDDVWEDDYDRRVTRKSLFNCGAKGSKIIVTTRHQSVGIAIGAVRVHKLNGLSEEDSWNLFNSLPFALGYDNDPSKESLAKKLLKKCKGVPLAIWCMGSLLHIKTIQEWEEIERAGLPIVEGGYNDELMRILKLSYDHLPSNLKQCFTYCCLFPKSYRYDKDELIYHWAAQGYINLDEKESSFMHLLRLGFFQDVKEDEFDQIKSCEMHDIIYDLAMHLCGEETVIISNASLDVSSCTRYVSLMVDGKIGGLRDIPTSLLNVKSIRSCLLSGISPNLSQLCLNFKLLRTLMLSDLGIKDIPPSIGELKLVRYLDLSRNKFEKLPDSMENLVNLLVLNINSCKKLKAWPHNFKKLIKLWSLSFKDCDELWFMPEGIGELPCLQYLSEFKVVKESELDLLNGLLKQLKGYLHIKFSKEMEVEEELNWQLPTDVSLQNLRMSFYPSQRIGGWGNTNSTSKLESLELIDCKNVKYLPPLRFLPNLKRLLICNSLKLEFMEEEDEVNAYSNATSNKLFFPCLEKLVLKDLPKLKGWQGKVAMEEMLTSSTSSASSFLEFPNLSKLVIEHCPNLESFPQCPTLQELDLRYGMSLMNLLSYTYPSLRQLHIYKYSNSENLHLECPHLQRIEIQECDDLVSIDLVGAHEPSLRYLNIMSCEQLKSLHIEKHQIAGIKDMIITSCPELRLNLSETKCEKLLVQQGLVEVEGCKLLLASVDPVFVEQLFSLLSPREIRIMLCKGAMSLPTLASLQSCHFHRTHGIKSLHIPSPHLRKVYLYDCKGLTSAEFEVATNISIEKCSKLKNLRIAHLNSLERFVLTASPSMVAGVDWEFVPDLNECSCLTTIELSGVDGVFIERLLSSSTSLHGMSVFNSIGSLTLALTSLERFNVSYVSCLKILNVQSQNLTFLAIGACSQLTNVSIVNPTALTKLQLVDCPKLSLSTCVDWDALTNLNALFMYPLPPPEELPHCLLQRQALGLLEITDDYLW